MQLLLLHKILQMHESLLTYQGLDAFGPNQVMETKNHNRVQKIQEEKLLQMHDSRNARDHEKDMSNLLSKSIRSPEGNRKHRF